MSDITATCLSKTEFGAYLRAGDEFRDWMQYLDGFMAAPATLFLRISRNKANRNGLPIDLCYASLCKPVEFSRRRDPLVFLYDEVAKQHSTPLLGDPFSAPLDARPAWQRIHDFNRQAPRLYRAILDADCRLRHYLPCQPPPSSMIDHPEDDNLH